MDAKKKIDEVISYLENEEDIKLTNYKHKDSEGLGDTLEKVFAKFGITEELISKAGGGCGCNKRKKFLNQIFPYRKRKPE